MCCDDDQVLDLPAAAIEALAHYRRLRDRQGWGWGDDELPEFFRLARFSRLGDLTDALAATGGDWPAAIRRVAGDTPAPGLVVLDIDAGGTATPRVGAPRLACAGRPVSLDVVVDSLVDAELDVAGTPVTVEAGGAAVVTVDVDGPVLRVGALEVAGAVEVRPAASLRVRSAAWSRWSVVDEAAGGWWPEGVPPKHDGAHRPYFHARDTVLDVPAGSFTVTCTRGPEYATVTTAVTVGSGGSVVDLEPERLVDPAAEGWRSADLHVHLNYSGDLVVDPAQARAMQRGEGLELMNLTAGNLGGPHVYDRALFESTVGDDLWTGDAVARTSVEFRNDLLGHVHALAPSRPPVRYQTGHPGTEHPHDWPPNAEACADLRDAGASVAYAHPVFAGFGDDPDDPYGPFLAPHRTVEARELVADVALGLVDGLEVVSCFDDTAGAELFHRLLGSGLRPAAVAGSDVFLSFAHGPGVASNPPGWVRLYADLGDAPVSAEAVRDAVRAGRTVATNGPFLSLTVDGAGPGSVLHAQPGDVLDVRARVRGSGAQELVLHGPDGEPARRAVDGPDVTLTAQVPVDGPLWLAASARGGPHPMDPGRPVFAHTSAVHIEVDGRRVAREADVRWCLGLLDRLERLVVEEGRLDPGRRDAQLADHRAVLDRARAVYRAALTQGRTCE